MKDWLPLITVLIAQAVLIGLYFVRQRAEDKRRWNEKRLDVYSDFTAQYLRLRRLLTRARGPFPEKRKAYVHSDDYKAERAQWLDQYFQIQILATDPVRKAAEKVSDAVYDIEQSSDLNALEWIDLLRQADQVKRSFDEDVRHELGITKPRRRLTVQADNRVGLIIRSLFTRLDHDPYAEAVTALLRGEDPPNRGSSAPKAEQPDS